MKKFFTIFAAMLVAVAAWAGHVNITPTSPKSSDNLRQALASLENKGDTIFMADGVYDESANDYIAFVKDAVVIAEGENVILMPRVTMRVKNGSRAEIIGVKFNLSNLLSTNNWYENALEAGDANTGNRYVLKNCEFYNNPSKTIVRCASDKKLDSLIVDGCFIHDNSGVIFRLESTSLKGVTLTNTTIANVANPGDFWVAPINIRKSATTAKIIVDRCTFYHNTTISSSYADVTVGYDSSESNITTDVTISNCIFAQPSSYSAGRAINLVFGGTVENCLTYNYTQSTNGITGETTKTDCITGDPLFRAPAAGNYTLNYGSPAYEAGTEGSDIGDPRWLQAAHIVYCKMEYDWWTTSNAAIGAFATVDAGETKYNKAFPGVRMTKVGGEDFIWQTTLAPKYRYVKFARMNPSDEGDQNWGAETSQLTIPNSKYNFYTITSSSAQWKGESKTVTGNWSMYPAPDDTKIQLVGEMNGWSSNDFFTIADGGLTASLDIYLNKSGDGYEFKIIKGADMLSINNGSTDYWFTRANNSAAVAYNDANSKPCFINVDLAGNYTFTWTYATNTLTITYPQPVHADGYYLVGKLGKVGSKQKQWDVANLTASKKFSVNPSDENEYLLTYKLYEGDSIKVVKVQNDEIITWYPDGNDNEYVMTSDQAGDSKQIKFRPNKDGADNWWYNYIFVQGTTTSVDHVIDSEKAVKVLENGQLVIIKNGVRYNVLGTAVK